jgi:two-component system cell cycle sensor histidine kinase/response regulator CckA
METRLPAQILDNASAGKIRTETRLLLWVSAGLIGSFGVALLALLVSNWYTASVVAGGCLVATALSLVHYLHRIDKPSVKAFLHNAELVKHIATMTSETLVVTSLEGDCLAANDSFKGLFTAKIWNIGELGESEEQKERWHAFLEEAAKVGFAEQVFELGNKQEKLFSVEARRIDGILVFTFHSRDPESLLENTFNQASGIIDQWLDKTGQLAIICDANGRAINVLGRTAAWFGEESIRPRSLTFLNNNSRLVYSPSNGVQKTLDINAVKIPLASDVDGETYGHALFVGLKEKSNGASSSASRDTVAIDPVFDEAPIAIAIVDQSGKIKELNSNLKSHPAANDLNVGGSILSLVEEEDRKGLSALIDNAYGENQNNDRLDVRFNCHPQRVGQVSYSYAESADSNYVVLYINDATQEKSLERQFVQAQKMQAVGQLAGGVAHDFNNLLTAIIGFCDLLLVRHDAGDQSFSDIIQIKQNANRAANLVRQLLAFSRQQTLRPKVLNITDILAELSNLLRRLIGERINLSVVHGRDLKPIKADQGQLEQVIINLAVNARDAMDENGELTIRTSLISADHDIVNKYDIVAPDDYVMIEVVDTGCGIAKDDLGKIFEPFFTTKEVGQGTGLGLATVYGIVKQTGGFVFAESEVGVGTTFIVLLKAHQLEEGDEYVDASNVEDVPVRDLTGKGTVLIVEDEDPVRMFASRALTNKGYTVLEAASGESGLELLLSHEGTIDLLISDVVMPQMDGPALVAAARKEMPDLPVIFVSGYAEDMVRKGLEDENFHFLPKPFSLKELAENVKSILD